MTAKTEILYCSECSRFTFEQACSSCDQPTLSTKPAKFSPEDKYGRYRRMQKKVLEEKLLNEQKEQEP